MVLQKVSSKIVITIRGKSASIDFALFFNRKID